MSELAVAEAETTDDAEETLGAAWVSDVAFEGLSTGDGRFMVPGSLGHRDLPLTLMAMTKTPDFGGHAGAEVAGRMDAFSKDGKVDMLGAKLPAGVTAVRSTGVFDRGEFGSEIERMVGDEVLTGVSIDLAIMEWAFRDPETGELIDPETATDEQWERAFMGELEFAVVEGEIMAATVCPTPAFADARIALAASALLANHVWRAGSEYAAQHGVPEGQMMTTLTAALRIDRDEEPLVAAGGIAPLEPPRDWFYRPEADRATPLTVTDDGEIFGHIATWDTCHTGFLNGQWSQCVTAPRSNTGYAHFHVGEIVTAEGDAVPCGRLTVDTGHAPLDKGRMAAKAHYDQTGACAAFVRAIDGKHGIWVSGATKSGMTGEQLRDLRANPPSGDWRSVDRNLELIAALAVPVPGFPVPRSQLALSASADGELEVVAMILTGVVASAAPDEPCDCEDFEAEALAASVEGPEALDALIAAA